MTNAQMLSLRLIEQDAEFIYSLVNLNGAVSANYNIMAMPYVEVFTMGAYEWSVDNRINAPVMSDEDKRFYNVLRSGLKMFSRKYNRLLSLIKCEYEKSDRYFSSIRKPIARKLRWYDNVGTEKCEGRFCSNTLLAALYLPNHDIFSDHPIYGAYVKRCAVMAGRQAAFYRNKNPKPFAFKKEMLFEQNDYLFFERCPIKMRDEHGILLFSMLCAINYLTVFIDQYFIGEFTFKLRFGYMFYHYLFGFIQEVNQRLSTNLLLDGRWINREFRNFMAHYSLDKLELRETAIPFDAMNVITQAVYGEQWQNVKISIYYELDKLAKSIEALILI